MRTRRQEAAIIFCLILGDSIADGTAAALRRLGEERCAVVARAGASTASITRGLPATSAELAFVSAGSNDASLADQRSRLLRLRVMLGPARVTWLLPYNRGAAASVRAIGIGFGDRWIDLAALPSRDGIHPATYMPLARAIAPVLGAGPKVRAEARPAPAVGDFVVTGGATSILIFR